MPEAESGGEELTRFRSAGPGGSGLGLSIAARIAELHGGELTVRDREAGGSELVISFGVPPTHLDPDPARTGRGGG